MAKVVLIEAHPLIRLGLHQLLRDMAGAWEVLTLDGRSMGEFAYLECDVSMVILGMSMDPNDSWRALADVERLLHPGRTLLLSEPGTPWQPPATGHFASVYGCISRTAPVEVIEAAIWLGMSGGMPAAARSVTVGPTWSTSAASPSPTSSVVDTVMHRPAPSMTQNPPPLAPPPSAHYPLPSAPAAAPVPPRSALDPLVAAQLLNVTPRQYEVLTLLAKGYPIKTVSRMLNISTATAKAHASTLYQRLRVNSKGEAVYAARQRGVVFD